MPAAAKRTLVFGIICVVSLIAFVIVVQVQQLIGSKASFSLQNLTSSIAKECVKLTNKNSCTQNTKCSWKSSGSSVGICLPKEVDALIPEPSNANQQGGGSSQERPRATLEMAGVNLNYNPWAIWFSGKNITAEYKARVTYNGQQVGQMISIVLGPNGESGTFELPSNTFLPSCGQATCTYGLQLVRSRGYTNVIFFTAPGR
jgi:hypothetical protein